MKWHKELLSVKILSAAAYILGLFLIFWISRALFAIFISSGLAPSESFFAQPANREYVDFVFPRVICVAALGQTLFYVRTRPLVAATGIILSIIAAFVFVRTADYSQLGFFGAGYLLVPAMVSAPGLIILPFIWLMRNKSVWQGYVWRWSTINIVKAEWIKFGAALFIGALAFQGLLSLFSSKNNHSPAPQQIANPPEPQKTTPIVVDTGIRYTTIGITAQNRVGAYVGKTEAGSKKKREKECPNCKYYFGTARGRCVGYMTFISPFLRDIYVVGENAGDAENKALLTCRLRSPGEATHCWGAKAVCGEVD